MDNGKNNTKRHTINSIMEVRLERSQINIYVDNKKVNQCKYLLITIPKEMTIEQEIAMDKANSIDDLKPFYDNKLENANATEFTVNGKTYSISKEEEFIAHCSNLEAWAENDYNPNILHTNLSIPLLREMSYKDKKYFYILIEWLDNELLRQDLPNKQKVVLVESYRHTINSLITELEIKPYKMIASEFIKIIIIEQFCKAFIFRQKCECCEEYVKVDLIREYDIYTNAFDDNYYTMKCCEHCQDDGYFYEIAEYCDYCDRYVDTDDIHYYDVYEEIMCDCCAHDNLLNKGINVYREIEVTEHVLSERDIIEHGYKQIGFMYKADLESKFDFLKSKASSLNKKIIAYPFDDEISIYII